MPKTVRKGFVFQLIAVSTAVMLLGASTLGCGESMRSIKTLPSTPVAPDAAATAEKVPAGTQVPITLVQPISSTDTQSKEPVTTRQQGFVVAEDVRGKAGVVLISKGTPVIAQVTRKLHERVGREGKIWIQFESTTATNGQTVKLGDRPHRFAGRKRLGGVIAGSILLFPLAGLGLLFLLLQGGDVTVESGSGFTATVAD